MIAAIYISGWSAYIIRIMAVVELRQKSLRFDLSPAECETPHLHALLLEKLKKMYEHTCMDSSYVQQIVRILGEPAPRVWNPRKMNGEMQTSVIFEYRAEILVSQSEVKTQAILHGGNVIEITEHSGGVLATCTFGNHITGTILVDLHGIVNIGMTIPVRVSDAEYPQSTVNNVTVLGELLKPTHFNPRYILVAAGSDADIISARKLLTKLDEEIARISGHKRAQYFKAWMYPYKIVPARKSITLSSLLSKRQTKAMYVRLDDACDIANLEFLHVTKMPLVDSMTFVTFAISIIDEARRIWKDIEMFSETYADEDIFNEHKTIWSYYESTKFTDAPELPVAPKRAAKHIAISVAESAIETPAGTPVGTPAPTPVPTPKASNSAAETAETKS